MALDWGFGGGDPSDDDDEMLTPLEVGLALLASAGIIIAVLSWLKS